MKLNKIILSFCVSILGLYSCSIVPTLSKFPVSDIRLGLNKADVKTALTFENDSLVSIIQSDKLISGLDLSADSIRRR